MEKESGKRQHGVIIAISSPIPSLCFKGEEHAKLWRSGAHLGYGLKVGIKFLVKGAWLRNGGENVFKRGRTLLDDHLAMQFNLGSKLSGGFWVRVGLALIGRGKNGVWLRSYLDLKLVI